MFLSVCRHYRIPPLGEMAPSKGAASSGESDIWLIILEEIRRFQAVDGDPICRIPDLKLVGFFFALKHLVGTSVGWCEGWLRCIHTDEDMTC